MSHEGITLREIHDVVRSGGTTNIPKIQKIVQSFIGGKELLRTINPEEVIAYGAAMHAEELLRPDDTQDGCAGLSMLTLSLGIKSAGGKMSAIIPRYSFIPTKQSKFFTTCFDDQTTMVFEVTRVEGARTKDNGFLGKLVLEDLPKCAKGSLNVEVIFEMATFGDLIVTAVEHMSGKKNTLVITSELGDHTSESLNKEAEWTQQGTVTTSLPVEDEKENEKDEIEPEDNLYSVQEVLEPKTQAVDSSKV